jgi:hypothetical protein
MAVKTYDAAEVQVIISGIPIQGVAAATFLSMARDSDTWTKIVGASGEVARSKSNDQSGVLTLTLLQTSASNDLLSALATTDELTNNGVGPLLIKDNSGRLLLQAESSWIQKPSDVERAQETSNTEWTIAYDKDTGLRGGH